MGKVAITDEILRILEKVGATLESDTNISLIGPQEQIPQDALGLYVEALPCVSYFPFLETKHPEMDVVIIRETESSKGTEYKQTPNVCSFTKTISRKEIEKVIRFAFDYALSHGRKKVTCFTNESLQADRLFFKVFSEIAHEYSDILHDSLNVDVGAAKLAETPEIFDVIVVPNLYSEIICDVAREITGASNLGVSINLGDQGAVFKALHESSLILGAAHMLAHLGQVEAATLIHNAWLKTLEDGSDIVQNLGKKPSTLQSPVYTTLKPHQIPEREPQSPQKRHLVGVDIFIYHEGVLGQFLDKVSHINMGPFRLKTILNRDVLVWPEGKEGGVFCEQWCCRFLTDGGVTGSLHDIVQVLHAFDHMQMDVIRSEMLYSFGGQQGY